MPGAEVAAGGEPDGGDGQQRGEREQGSSTHQRSSANARSAWPQPSGESQRQPVRAGVADRAQRERRAEHADREPVGRRARTRRPAP